MEFPQLLWVVMGLWGQELVFVCGVVMCVKVFLTGYVHEMFYLGAKVCMGTEVQMGVSSVKSIRRGCMGVSVMVG